MTAPYPPQQQGAAYPPQPQLTDYQPGPPQPGTAAYPPQQPGTAAYPPQQPAYPQQQQQPPPYYPQQQPVAAQQSSSNVVVVTQQPKAATTTVYTRHYGSGDHGLIYAIIASILICLCGAWCGLWCTIPAIFIAINAQQAEQVGDTVTMARQHRLSIILTTVGIVCGYVGAFIWIISVAARNSAAASSNSA